jgi:MYXO-CTERM domain-containing protein
MIRARRLAALLAGIVLLAGGPAHAVYKCGNQADDCLCGKSNPYPCCDNGGNCTWWAWESACCHWKIGLPGWGNANQWAGNAKANPKFVVKSAPVAKSIGVRVSGSYGHVVWVTGVSGSTVTVSEMNCWGNYGVRTATYQASYFDGGFIVPKAQCVCTPGQKETQACGECGKKTRSCGSDCQWGAWGACVEGSCPAPTPEAGAPLAVDAGAPRSDQGAPGIETGPQGRDAGTGLDADPVTPEIDASRAMPHESAEAPAAGELVGGCACQTGGQPGASTLLFLLGLLLARRRGTRRLG